MKKLCIYLLAIICMPFILLSMNSWDTMAEIYKNKRQEGIEKLLNEMYKTTTITGSYLPENSLSIAYLKGKLITSPEIHTILVEYVPYFATSSRSCLRHNHSNQNRMNFLWQATLQAHEHNRPYVAGVLAGYEPTIIDNFNLKPFKSALHLGTALTVSVIITYLLYSYELL